MAELIAHSRLLELLNYDPETGKFTWRKTPRARLWRICEDRMMLRIVTAFLLALWASSSAIGAGLYPLSNTQQFDSNGKVMPGARLFLYDGGTSTPRIAYKDLALTTQHPTPIVADSSGRLPLIYLADGYYRQRLTSRTATLIFDQDGIPVLTTSAGGTGTTVDPDSVLKTRDIKIRYDDQPLAGYVRLNGRTIGSAASGATERANADTQSLYEELWSYSNISVSGGKGASASADFAANKALTLPNAAGRALMGLDDMGNGVQNVITSTTCGSPTVVGTVCGTQAVVLSASQLPTTSPWSATASVTVTGTTDTQGFHAHTGTTDSGGPSAHNHNYTRASNTNFAVQAGSTQAGMWNGSTTDQTGIENSGLSHAHTFTTAGSGSHAHNVTATGTPVVTMGSNVGGGQSVSKLPPMMTIMIYIRL